MSGKQYYALMQKAQGYQDAMRAKEKADLQQYGHSAFLEGTPMGSVGDTAKYMQFQKYFRPVGTDRTDVSGLPDEINTQIADRNTDPGLQPANLAFEDPRNAQAKMQRMAYMRNKYNLSDLLSGDANNILSQLKGAR